jgi:hypothetical protein
MYWFSPKGTSEVFFLTSNQFSQINELFENETGIYIIFAGDKKSYKKRLDFFNNYFHNLTDTELLSFKKITLFGEEARNNVTNLLLTFCDFNTSFYLAKMDPYTVYELHDTKSFENKIYAAKNKNIPTGPFISLLPEFNIPRAFSSLDIDTHAPLGSEFLIAHYSEHWVSHRAAFCIPFNINDVESIMGETFFFVINMRGGKSIVARREFISKRKSSASIYYL